MAYIIIDVTNWRLWVLSFRQSYTLFLLVMWVNIQVRHQFHSDFMMYILNEKSARRDANTACWP